MVKKGRIAVFFLIVLLLAAVVGWTAGDVIKNIRLGLDLQGGFEVLYEVQPPEEGGKVTEEVLQSTVEALRQRVDALGVSEPNIQIEGNNRIRVQLAGVENQAKAREILSTQAELTFRDVNDKLLMDGSALVPGEATVVFENNKPIVSIELKSAEQFAKVTRQVLKEPPVPNLLVIWLDYEKGDSFREEVKKENPKFISAPRVTQVLNTTDVVITGDFTLEEAQTLASLLNAGALPVELEEIYSTSVGPQFGENALKTTVTAGYVAVALIFLFMIAYYRLPGVISVVSLVAYMYLILLVFNWMNAVLTLPGIAAFILGIGMAVDANVITYERIKEELRAGKSVLSAFRAGNRHSFVTIFDANLTTILAAVVLFIYGTSSVQGFVVMLIVSILASFVTAVYGTRLLLGLWVKSKLLDRRPRFFGVKESEIREL